MAKAIYKCCGCIHISARIELDIEYKLHEQCKQYSYESALAHTHTHTADRADLGKWKLRKSEAICFVLAVVVDSGKWRRQRSSTRTKSMHSDKKSTQWLHMHRHKMLRVSANALLSIFCCFVFVWGAAHVLH